MPTSHPAPGRRPSTAAPAPNHGGVHLLADPALARRLVAAARLGPGDLVLDLGAGPGALTAPLAATGARVLAVERDPRFLTRLERRFADRPNVRVVGGDLRTVPLPRRAHAVVANIPFAVSTALVRRLLDPADGALVRADLVVEHGFGARLAGPPRDLAAAWWTARFDVRLAARIPRGRFAPAPSVDAAHVVVVRRPAATSPRALAVLWALLAATAADPRRPVGAVLADHVPRRRAHRLATATGLDPPAPGADVAPASWAALADAVAVDPTRRARPLPRPPATSPRRARPASGPPPVGSRRVQLREAR